LKSKKTEDTEDTLRRKDSVEVGTIGGTAGVAARSKVSRANVVLIAIETQPKNCDTEV